MRPRLPLWRSLLYVPVVNERFVAKAAERGADAIILELEDAVAPSEKERARGLVEAAVPRVGQGGADVLVRVNRPWRLAVRDLEASVVPGVRALVLPKVDSAEHVVAVAEVVAELEAERGLEHGSVALFPRIESARGLASAAEIAAAHERVVAIGLGSTDFSLSAGMEPGGIGNVVASFQVVVAAVAAGRVPIGLVSVIYEYADLEGFRRVAEESRALGLRGSPCVHPSQVPILNEVFSPSGRERERAARIVEEFERALGEGSASMTVDGEFVDVPIYEQAKRLLGG